MKKILMIFAAMAAVLSSCSKSELESATANESKDIVLNISVSNPGADDSKALIKTGWAEGDEISIWYDSNVQKDPDLVVKYDGSKWIQKTGATVSGNNPLTGDGKYAKALYNGTVKVASKDGYTYDGTTLTFNIANWTFLTEVQVVVKGLTSASAGSYTLSCDKFTPCTDYSVGADGIIATKGTKGTAVTGISNTDGVAFVFATAEYSTSSTDKKDFAFTLKDKTSGSEVTTVYKPNVAIEAKVNKATIKALAIANTKFKSPVPDGFVDLGVVVNSKPVYWATKNLGASTPEDYGTYFSWGDIAGRSESDLSSKPFNWSNATIKQSVSNWDTYCTNYVLNSAYDAAYKADKTWRMPTSDEFQALFEACGGTGGSCRPTSGGSTTTTKRGIYWCNSYNGESGVLFIAKDNGPHLFFPAAGYGSGTDLYDAGDGGNYWSSSLYSSFPDKAFNLYFTSGDVYPQSGDERYYGFPVRPVSN